MKLIDTFPTDRIGDLQYCVGRVFPFGATLMEDGVNFSIYSKEAKSCTLLLYHHGQPEPFVEIPFPDRFRIGDVYAMMVFGIQTETTEYGYRFDGEYDPRRGLLFNPKNTLLDPYAKSVSGRSVWGREPDWSRPFQHRGQFIREDFDWEGDKPLEIAPEKLIICEIHVRSFTRHETSGVKYKGTFAGLAEKIPYLKELGVNCVELMPVFEFDEFDNARVYNGTRLMNYWGYSTVNFFSPKAGYAASAPFGMEADELKAMIRQLHRNGIEVILDVVFNHTAEGNEKGPSISFRGIDNRTYYLLTTDGYYINFSGCGNTMNCNNPIVRGMILDCLRYWVSAYHVDGFRFDLAAILSRDENGAPMMNPPLLDSIANDAVLGKSVLIAEAWDAGGLYQVGSFPAFGRWAEWNGKYRDCVRRYIKGDGGCAPELYRRVRGSDDMYRNRGPAASVNYITCHDGFTLYDLVSYNEKHNECNGEGNRDGTDDNYSWNCGVEGDTNDPAVNALRLRQMKNMLTLLLTSRGIPMLLSGDEFANSQHGNNNAYCQDNEISWLDWSLLDKHKDLFDYVRRLIAFRKAHPVLSAPSYDFSPNGTGYPEFSLHGTRAWHIDEHSPGHCFAYLYAEDHLEHGTEEDAFIYVAVNAHWEEHRFTLPVLPASFGWHLAFEAYGFSSDPGKESPCGDSSGIILGPRTAAVLVGRKKGGRRRPATAFNKSKKEVRETK